MSRSGDAPWLVSQPMPPPPAATPMRCEFVEHLGGKVSTAGAVENAKRADFGDLTLI
ncbi:MAG: hypothetical protein PUD64_10330 [Bacteroidales bacterium]|nr:hypothetical protein [Bacteroidales bacterium]